MATYTYKCESCEVVYETVQSVHDEAISTCAECGEKDSAKRIMVPGTSFRIGGLGVHKPTSMFNNSGDIRR